MKPGNAEGGIGLEHLRVEEEVVDPPVDDIDADEAADGPEVEAVVAVDDEVLALHQVGAHLLSEEGVLEVGRVEDARRQDRDDGCLARPGREGGEEAGQLVGVAVDGLDVEIAEQVGEDPLGDLAVLEHVGDARRHAQVVLEHVHRPVRVTHEVAAADMGPHALGRSHPVALGAVVHRRSQHLGREHTIGHDPGGAVQVADEQVEGGEPLDEPRREALPLLGRDHPRNDVEGPVPVDVGGLAVHGEGDTHRADGQLRRLLAPGELVAQRHEVTHHPFTGWAWVPVDQQLVPASRALVAVPHAQLGLLECLVSKWEESGHLMAGRHVTASEAPVARRAVVFHAHG